MSFKQVQDLKEQNFNYMLLGWLSIEKEKMKKRNLEDVV